MIDSEKSMRNFVNDTNLRLTGLSLPHQSIGEEGVNLDDLFLDRLVEVVVEDVLRYTGGIHLGVPAYNPPAQRADADADARGKGKEKFSDQFEVETSDDEGIWYSTLLDHLPIPEELFSGINFLNQASSVLTL